MYFLHFLQLFVNQVVKIQFQNTIKLHPVKTLVWHIFNEFLNIFIILCFNYNNRLHLLTYLFYNHDLQHRNMARDFLEDIHQGIQEEKIKC